MATGPTTYFRIIDLDKMSEKHDAHLLRTLLFQLLVDMQNIATKLDGESTLTNKNYVSGVLTKFR